MLDPTLQHWVEAALGGACALSPLSGGGNSRVLRVDCPQGRTFALKRYGGLPGDRRDRLGVEFNAFAGLRRAGVDMVPLPVACEPGLGCALYEFVAGEKPQGREPGEIDQFCAFLGLLDRLAQGPLGREAQDASEAFFTLPGIEANLRRRRQRLEPAARAGLADFLKTKFDPACTAALSRAQDLLGPTFGPDCLLAPAGRILSPSDFGLHNALKRADGTLVFVDFEYFGWDDPAKTVSDFLLHPRMELDTALKARFVRGMQAILSDRPGFAPRLNALLPLFGLAWCLIFLNEFLPGGLERRRLLGETSPDAQVLQAQSGKAAAMLERMQRFMDHDMPAHLA